MAGLVALAAGVGAVVARSRVAEPARALVHVGLALPPDGNVSHMAVTPDGTRVVYVGGGGSRLLVRARDSIVPAEIATGSLLSQPFISPNGLWVGDVDEASRLLKVPIGGGSPTDLGVVGGRVMGATWLTGDTIVVATAAATGLLRLPAAGGPATPMTTPAAGTDHVLPQRLPDGRGVVFTMTSRANTFGLNAAIEEFEAYMPWPTERRLEMVGPPGRTFVIQEPPVPGDPDSTDNDQTPTSGSRRRTRSCQRRARRRCRRKRKRSRS